MQTLLSIVLTAEPCSAKAYTSVALIVAFALGYCFGYAHGYLTRKAVAK